MTGTVETLPAGTFGVDYSFGRPTLADMQALGVQFASRYICIDNADTHDKLVTPDEIRRLADAGILMMINYEQGASTTLGGDAAGRKHGKVAGDWRAYLEMPDDLAIVISTDVGVTSSQFSAISDFCAAFSETGGGKIGHYHGTTLCAHLEGQGLNELTWMAMATSWSPGGETPAVHVRQKGYVLNGSCDANYVRKPTPFWNFNGETPPPPEPLPEAYMIVLRNTQGWWKELVAGQARAIFYDEAQRLIALKVPIQYVDISDADWENWPAFVTGLQPHTHDVSGSRPL